MPHSWGTFNKKIVLHIICFCLFFCFVCLLCFCGLKFQVIMIVTSGLIVTALDFQQNPMGIDGVSSVTASLPLLRMMSYLIPAN